MHILIVRKNSNSKAVDASLLLGSFLAGESIDYSMLNASECFSNPNSIQRQVDLSAVDLVVVLGGDGTMLLASHLVGLSRVPILGINFGRLGFLTNDGSDGVIPLVAGALAGELQVEQRANLQIDVVCEGERDPYDDEVLVAHYDSRERAAHEISADERNYETDEKELEGQLGEDRSDAVDCGRRHFFALNELAITRGALGRVIDFNLSINGGPMGEMRGDGLIVATATGSTAYSLSAGGPLVGPNFQGMIVTPLALHQLSARSVLTAENDVVEVDLTSLAADREATLFVDGEMLEFGHPVRRVYVRRGGEPTVFLRSDQRNFYQHVAEVFF